MPPAARVGDPTGHPGAIAGPGVATVLIGGQPAAVMGDNHVCAWPSGHPATPMAVASATVRIGGRGAVRMGDTAGCGAPVVFGLPTVMVGS